MKAALKWVPASLLDAKVTVIKHLNYPGAGQLVREAMTDIARRFLQVCPNCWSMYVKCTLKGGCVYKGV